ncbi:Glutaredoxin-3 [Strongyloides ratti]|uniref:Glutaredoxin-3 n=1 Tax=Strongyloides ratti TaxID=34506 RepID=A0A090L582_STRRB|nr:Glutaredoxin-3 [Strongyloides ratti]CEF63242.1 Glutaredoxin-3 [Strongyloides ratti]
MTLQDLKNLENFNEFISKNKLAVVVFSATWVPQCGQVLEIIEQLVEDNNGLFTSASIDAEGVAEVSSKYSISAVPTVVFFRDGKEIDRVNGFSPSAIRNSVTKLITECSDVVDNVESVTKEDLNSRLKKLINKSKLVVFMKGNREQPRCGFSRQVIELLNNVNANYWTFDILEDDEVRQGLKVYSDWPTYPQIYLDGELIGGLDIFREELKDQAFVDSLPKL